VDRGPQQAGAHRLTPPLPLRFLRPWPPLCGPRWRFGPRLLASRPGAAAPSRTAEEDVEEIARHFGIAAEALLRVVEEAAG